MSHVQKFRVNDVTKFLNEELRKIAEDEGPDGMLMLEHTEFVIDYGTMDAALRVAMEYRGQRVWQAELDMSREQMDRGMVDELFKKNITSAMRGTLSLVGQMHHARLDKLFPKSIKEVKVSYDPEKARKVVNVHFHNGHVASADEMEAKTELFTARCSLLYDLPPLAKDSHG